MSSQKGAAVVEFALLALLLLVFVFGIIEFGFIWLQSHYIGNAAREGARVASKTADVDPSGPTLNNSAEVRAAVEDAIQEYLEGAVVYSAAKVNQCCNEGNFIYIETPALETITGSTTPGIRVSLTVRTADIWEPVLWELLSLLPGSDLGEIRQIRETALFPVINN
jgi:Flp pilus assembly protein TadG